MSNCFIFSLLLTENRRWTRSTVCRKRKERERERQKKNRLEHARALFKKMKD